MPLDLIVTSSTQALWQGQELRCAIGRGGFCDPENRTEGDGTTPIGRWKMRRVFYRADRMAPPETALPLQALKPEDGWCDALLDAQYNRLVKHPYPSSAEHLWREDEVYDLIVELAFNDDPVIAGRGSAIFMHIARPDYRPTAGCVVLNREDLLNILRQATVDSAVDVRPA